MRRQQQLAPLGQPPASRCAIARAPLSTTPSRPAGASSTSAPSRRSPVTRRNSSRALAAPAARVRTFEARGSEHLLRGRRLVSRPSASWQGQRGIDTRITLTSGSAPRCKRSAGAAHPEQLKSTIGGHPLAVGQAGGQCTDLSARHLRDAISGDTGSEQPHERHHEVGIHHFQTPKAAGASTTVPIVGVIEMGQSF